MSDANRMRAVDVINAAAQAVGVDREATHGSMIENMEHTARLWSAYLGVPITAMDVPLMMALLKVSRAKIGKARHDDHFVDGAGYFGIAGGVAAALSKNQP
jgi:hypothetical protein